MVWYRTNNICNRQSQLSNDPRLHSVTDHRRKLKETGLDLPDVAPPGLRPGLAQLGHSKKTTSTETCFMASIIKNYLMASIVKNFPMASKVNSYLMASLVKKSYVASIVKHWFSGFSSKDPSYGFTSKELSAATWPTVKLLIKKSFMSGQWDWVSAGLRGFYSLSYGFNQVSYPLGLF